MSSIPIKISESQKGAVEKLHPLIERFTLPDMVAEGEGAYEPPTLDLEAIRARADELDPTSQTKADIYLLLMELQKNGNGRD